MNGGKENLAAKFDHDEKMYFELYILIKALNQAFFFTLK